jgi:hypothetical protein
MTCRKTQHDSGLGDPYKCATQSRRSRADKQTMETWKGRPEAWVRDSERRGEGGELPLMSARRGTASCLGAAASTSSGSPVVGFHMWIRFAKRGARMDGRARDLCLPGPALTRQAKVRRE